MTTMNLISGGETYTVSRDDAALYRVSSGGRLLGFVERVGALYVALAGTRYDRAVETGQAHSLAQAAGMLRRPAERTLVRRLSSAA